jgi:hypothetical protein
LPSSNDAAKVEEPRLMTVAMVRHYFYHVILAFVQPDHQSLDAAVLTLPAPNNAAHLEIWTPKPIPLNLQPFWTFGLLLLVPSTLQSLRRSTAATEQTRPQKSESALCPYPYAPQAATRFVVKAQSGEGLRISTRYNQNRVRRKWGAKHCL